MAVLSPPGPKGRFFSGNLPEFRQGRLDFLRRCADEYGDVVALRFGPRRITLLSHPDAIEEVVVTQNHNFIKHFALRMNPLVLGKGLLTSEGDFWLRQRRLVQPAFQRKRLSAFSTIMVEYTDRLLNSWTPGEQRDILTEMMRLTLEITAKTLFGADAGKETQAVNEALRFLQNNFIARFNSLLTIPLIIPTPTNLRMRRAVRRLDEIIYGFIRQRRASQEDRSDLLSLLLHARDEVDRTQMTDQQLRDEAMTLFLAGHETTALALSWTWYLLASHAAAEERLAAEVSEVLGGRLPTVEDLPRLRFTEQVVLESMRLYPPAYTIGREALTDCEIAGYRIPRGMTALMSQWVVHRDKRWFEEPDEFHPERWAGDFAQRIPKYAYFPFGGGPRLCIGNTFAMMEMVLALATIAQRYRFTLVPGQEIVPWPTFTLRPKDPIWAVLQRR